jgi:GTP:adenosylcobinamide-phosphate guanylyltransferase
MIALVLAGGRADDVARMQEGAANKAFVRIGGVSLLERTIRPLRESSAIARIIVVAPPATHAAPEMALADERRADGEKIRTSLRNGLNGLPDDELVLVSTSDLPVMSGPAVDDFVASARALDPDLGYGCVERSVHLARYPQMPHTWTRLREGTFCGAGLIVIKPRVLPSLERFIERLGRARKNPFALASLFGWDILLKFAIGRLAVGDAEARASAILGAKVRAIVSPFAEIAVNVDRVTDVALAAELVERPHPRE